jgi:antitoxin ParD1/3/4
MTTETIGFRPNATDRRILAESGASPTEAIRRGLRLLDHERWLEQARADALRLSDEDLASEPDAW